MEKKTDIKKTIGNAICSLYQMIMAVNADDMECHVVDYNKEIQNISDDINLFDEFCEDLHENIHPEDRAAFEQFTSPNYFPRALSEKVYTSMECRIRQTNHKYYWSKVIFCNATEKENVGGKDYLFMIQDIHDSKMQEIREDAEQRNVFQGLQQKYDALFEENMLDQQTGCYNRKGMKYYSDMVIREARDTGKYLFVCVSDLNGLKYLNDTYGHAAGDEAIATVSSVLLASAPQGTRIVRTGGDEFLLFAALDKDSKEPEAMAEKLDAGLAKYNKEHENPYEIGASYGYVLLPVKEDMINLDEYVEMADAKMYEMKVQRDKHRRDK